MPSVSSLIIEVGKQKRVVFEVAFLFFMKIIKERSGCLSGKLGKSIHSFLVAQTEHSVNLLAHPVHVLPNFGIDQFSIDLGGDDGLVPEDFLQGFKWYAFVQNQGRKGMTYNISKIRQVSIQQIKLIVSRKSHIPNW